MRDSNSRLLLLIDGNNLVHRAFHAIPPLSVRRTGELTNAVYGFTLMFLKVLSDLNPSHYAIAFDKHGPTFRHNMFAAYKANRIAIPDELIGQMNRVRQMSQELKIPLFELDGFEADDLIGTLSIQAKQKGIETIILTGDADAMQLVGQGVRVLYPRAMAEAVLLDADGVKEKYGVLPERIVDLKALKGDASDNIPGVKGIGDKTALKLIEQFGCLEDIYQHLDEVGPPRIQRLLRDDEENARRSKQLATIDIQAPVTLDLDKARVELFDHARAVELFRDMEFFKLIDRLPGTAVQLSMSAQQCVLPTESATTKAEHVEIGKKKVKVINTQEELENLTQRLINSTHFALEVLSEGAHPFYAQLVGLAFSLGGGEEFYIPLCHSLLEIGPQFTLENLRSQLSLPLSKSLVTMSVHNANQTLTILKRNAIPLASVNFDTMLASHLLGEQVLELSSLALVWLNMEIPSLAVGTGSKRVSVVNLPVEQVAENTCRRASAVWHLAKILRQELETQDLLKLFEQVELPLVPLLVDMQCNGMLLDKAILVNMSRSMGERIQTLESEIHMLAATDFNINSPKQLAEVLFDKLRIQSEQKKKGAWTTESSVLESLKNEYPIADLILQYRQLNKLRSTYIDALPGLVDSGSGRIHTSFNQTRTSTGRLSSSEPNLQNIPVRNELGREIRKAFIAQSGHVLVSGDYSQIDLRVLAHLSTDEALMAMFEHGDDVHSATAASLFDVEVHAVTKDMRRLAKTVNFGVIYGMSGYGLEQATGLTRSEAEEFIVTYFSRFPGVRDYLEKTKEQARKLGYVQTLLGRRRYIQDINSPNRMIREAAERMAINMPVQGTSADIIKVAMLSVDQEIARQSLKAKMLLQVHDELIFEVPQDELSVVEEFLPRLMENAVRLSVPVTVDIKIGSDWGRMEEEVLSA
ncbi:MAG: DNA polymerase I [Dehalococcoidia bacterium]|nr:DNA polymerase I [Dehalococcoidia bacterium]